MHFIAYVGKEKLFQFEAASLKLAVKKAKRIHSLVTHVNGPAPSKKAAK